MTNENQGHHQYVNQSRGYKTKGASYKERYVEKQCPECGHDRAYCDEWKTKYAYTCLKRACRHRYYENKIFEQEKNTTETEEA